MKKLMESFNKFVNEEDLANLKESRDGKLNESAYDDPTYMSDADMARARQADMSFQIDDNLDQVLGFFEDVLSKDREALDALRDPGQLRELARFLNEAADALDQGGTY